MNSRERLLAALAHREPDRLPLDLGSTQVTGIHRVAYARLRAALGLPPKEPAICDAIQQLALPDDDLVELLGVDVRGLFPLNSHNWNVVERDAGACWAYLDEWGIRHHRPKPDGLYYSIAAIPLAGEDLTREDVRAYPWPDTGDPRRIAGLREQALAHRARGRAVMLKGVLAGMFEMSQRLRGMEQCLIDVAANPFLFEAFLEKMLELKLAFWETALPALAGVVDVVSEADDYGTQESQIVSPRTFRTLIKPRLALLFARIKRLAPGVKLFFHSDGNVRPILPDLIEIGIDILNPVQTSARGMEALALKRDFGRDLVFWGGAVDTQSVLPFGTPEQVEEDVRRNLDALAPGGGYVCNAVHNIQADVPPANMVALFEACRRYGGRT
jgi:uroporphyrinogen decarboxylase